MLQNWWSVLGLSSLVLFFVSRTNYQAIASEIEPTSSNRNSSLEENLLQQLEPLAQINSVSQLRDVSPTDWAYEALRGLTERYSDARSRAGPLGGFPDLKELAFAPDGDAGSHRCIAGFPDSTYRGGQALSRYEFAAGLNSCLNQIESLIASSEAVLREDINTIKRLIKEFKAELATIGGRIDSSESRTAFLEDNQFPQLLNW